MWKLRKTGVSVIFVAALGLAACGGGGGGSGSDDSSGNELDTSTASSTEINDSNSGTVSNDTAQGSTAVASGGQSAESIFVGGAETDGTESATSASEATNFGVKRLLELSEQTPVAVSGVTDSYNCPDGGSAAITETDNGTPGELDPGDKWTGEWKDCKSETSSSSTYIDGTIEFEVVSCSNCAAVGDNSQDWSYEITISYTDWVVQFTQSGTTTTDILIDGGVTFKANNDSSASTITYTTTGGPWIFRDRLANEGFGFGKLDLVQVNDRSNSTYTLTINTMEFISTDMDGKVSAKTTTSLAGPSGSPPTSGVLVIDGANSTTATVDAGACNDSEYDLTVNGTNQGCQTWN